ncbi:ATP-binding protein [Pseudonocardia kunmingensis]|uniref:histidine kinase n=1 Tax=Pseudonocardia kunmingensis TaxID=630975 RepID=A0A543E0U4_9PSEU|nr:ATP-binding protein [Pseudonocardia kunmingensis]TQM15210.1 signal transduction histidine kinase [Pseudonocardia kunmingensis]
MQTSTPIGPPVEGVDGEGGAANRLLAYLPRGNTLDDRSWHRRHRLLQWVLAIHLPAIAVLGLALGNSPLVVGYALIAPVAFLVLGHVLRTRRLASSMITGGLVFCSAGLVVLTSGSIEAHFHFFIIIGFIALYQDWVPFLWNVGFTVVSHGIGTLWLGGLIFSHPAGQANPWLWSAIHGIAVLFACVGMVIFWRITEDEQTEKEALGRRLLTADAEIGRRRFTSDMLVNLARRNQSMLYRQLDIINQLEEKERDPDTLSDLFTLDHLATRVRRNAESLLVLAGEQSPRTWTAPVPLRDVVRAAIAETEDLDRVVFAIDDRVAVSGQAVADLTHLLAELTENAVRFSPPDTAVTIRARPDRRDDGGYLLTIEDWGVGMPPDDLDAANELLAVPREVDLAVAQRLGFHVVARLAARHGVGVSLGNTPGSGVTAIVSLPAALFARPGVEAPPAPLRNREALHHREALPQTEALPHAETLPHATARPYVTGEAGRPAPRVELPSDSTGWVEPFSTAAPSPASNGAGAEPARGDAGWRGWWNPESAAAGSRPPGGDGIDGARTDPSATGAQRQTLPAVPPAAEGGRTPSPSPRPRPADSDIPEPRTGGEPPASTGEGRPGLRRRVPQAHLAPELRHPASEEPDFSLPPDGGAASALSRYQASRQAAQAVVDGAGADGRRS